MMNSVHFESGNNEIAFVFSCPGKEEENSDPPGPAKGQTGKNLEVVLQYLSQNHDLEGFTRKEIVITNAWNKVEYQEKTQRSEASFSEIAESGNLNRLSSEVENIQKCIVTCGESAKFAINCLTHAGKLSTTVKIVNVAHLGNQGINSSISIDIDGKEIKSYKNSSEIPDTETRSLKEIRKENRLKRLAVVADRIYNQIAGKRVQAQ